MRESTICQPMAMISVTQSEKGMPRTVPVPMKIEQIGIEVSGDDGGRHPQEQDVVDRAEDDQRDQGGEEGAEPQIADQIAVDRAADDAHRHHADSGEADREAFDIGAEQRGQHRQGEDRGDREIDAARHQHDREAEHDQAELGHLKAEIGEAGDREEARRDDPEHRHQHDQGQEREPRCRSSAWPGSPRSDDRGETGTGCA